MLSSRRRSLVWPVLFVVTFTAVGYTALRFKRDGLVDLVAPRTAATRFLAQENLYRPDDGHYQFKYLPAFAPLMAPFNWVSTPVAEVTWFALMVTMAWVFIRLSVTALPGRRRSERVLVWLTLLLTGKFFVREFVMGQYNLPLALLLLGAIIAAQRGRGLWAGASVAAGVFIKPYALILVPWLAWTQGWRPFLPFGVVMVIGLLLPAVTYGWNGNLTLLYEWYRTVTETTEPNLFTPENISFASMWAKWIGSGPTAKLLATASAVAAVTRRPFRDVAAATRGRTELPGRRVFLRSGSSLVAARLGLRAPARGAGLHVSCGSVARHVAALARRCLDRLFSHQLHHLRPPGALALHFPDRGRGGQRRCRAGSGLPGSRPDAGRRVVAQPTPSRKDVDLLDTQPSATRAQPREPVRASEPSELDEMFGESRLVSQLRVVRDPFRKRTTDGLRDLPPGIVAPATPLRCQRESSHLRPSLV